MIVNLSSFPQNATEGRNSTVRSVATQFPLFDRETTKRCQTGFCPARNHLGNFRLRWRTHNFPQDSDCKESSSEVARVAPVDRGSEVIPAPAASLRSSRNLYHAQWKTLPAYSRFGMRQHAI